VVLAGADDQQRRTFGVLEVHLGRWMEVEVREAGLVEDLPCLRDRVALVRGGSLLGRECVHERVGEFLGCERDDAVPLGGVGERRRACLERRERQGEDALRRRRAHRHASAAEPAVEQQLDEQAAVRMADQHRRLLELADQRRVVVDDLPHPETAWGANTRSGEARGLLGGR
jgi:hypothetical protein